MFRRSTSRTDTAVAPPEVDIATVTEATFLQDTAGEVALIDFWAPWCAPCRAFAPVFHDVAAQRSRTGLRFGSCNVDDNPETAALLGIQTIPTVVAFDAAGNELARIVGVPSRQDLDALVEKAEGGTVTVRATWNGTVLAESDDTVVVDGNHYFPPDTLRREHLEPSDERSICPWKGVASYYDVVVAGDRNRAAAWYYPEPKEAAAAIGCRVAFWRGVEVRDAV